MSEFVKYGMRRQTMKTRNMGRRGLMNEVAIQTRTHRSVDEITNVNIFTTTSYM